MGNNIIENGFLSIDSIESRLKFKKINGASRQATRDGSNLYNVYDRITGMTYPVDENDWLSVSLDNTEGATTQYYNIFTKASSQVKTSTTYYLVVEIKNVSGSGRIVFTSSLQGSQFKNTTDVYFSAIKSGDIIIKEINTLDTFESSTMFLRSFVQATAGQSGSITFRISVFEQKPDLETFIYQPYGVMPSPDYPSTVETVGSNINEFDFNSNYLEDAGIDTTGKIISSSYIVNYCKVQPGKTYTLSRPTSMQYVITTTKNIPAIEEQGTTRVVKISKDYTITIPEGYNYICIRHIKDGNEDNTFLKIEKGEKATPYSKYREGNVEINIINKNFMVTDNIEKTINGVSVVCKDGVLVLNGKATGSVQIDFSVFKLKAGKYRISRGVVGGSGKGSYQNYLRNEDGSHISGAEGDTTITFSKDIKVKYRFFINPNSQFNNYTMIPMLELGSVSTTPEPRKSQTKVVPIQEEMLEDDYIDDVEYHTWGKIVLTGNEDFKLSGVTTSNNYYLFNEEIKQVIFTNNEIPNFKSNKLQPISLNTMFNNNNIYGISQNLATEFRISVPITVANRDVTAFKEWLSEQYNSGNPVVVYYKLAAPKSLPLTEEQQEVMDEIVYLYEGITNISVESNVLPTIETEVKKIVDDYDIYISTDGHLVIPEYDIRYLIDLNESSIPSMPEAVESSVRAAGRDGDVVLNTTYEPMSFNITCYTDDNLSITEKTENERKINAFLNSIKNKTKRFAIEKDNKFYNIKYNAALTTINYPSHLKFSIPFKSSDSYAKDLKQKTIIGNSSQESDTINDVGAIFIIKGPATDPIISFNDYSMEYSTSILEGARIEIDSNKSTVTHINSDGIKTNVMKYYNHQFPKIENGNNILKILSGINDEQQVKVKWNDLKL